MMCGSFSFAEKLQVELSEGCSLLLYITESLQKKLISTSTVIKVYICTSICTSTYDY